MCQDINGDVLMTATNDRPLGRKLPTRLMCERYGVVDRTINRWEKTGVIPQAAHTNAPQSLDYRSSKTGLVTQHPCLCSALRTSLGCSQWGCIVSALPAPLIPQLDKLIRHLSSNHDGEVVATVRAIGRVLKSGGCDWHDLAARFRTPVTQIPHADWRLDVRFCFENADLLNERELDFITNIARGGRKPTDKQMKWLCAIADRLRASST